MSAETFSSNYSLNNVEMEKICDCKVIVYGDLAKYKDLDELFSDSDRIILCFLTRANYGHWCCLFKNDYGVEFFDSYGLKPDDELDWNIDEYFRKESDEDYPHLTWLLYKYNKNGNIINYNDYQFQSRKAGIATCGRWVIVRLALKKLSDIEYKECILRCCQILGISKDQLVVNLTAKILKGL